nr:MAG TPA: hypothetical protein [Caudoviricetes sp.]
MLVLADACRTYAATRSTSTRTPLSSDAGRREAPLSIGNSTVLVDVLSI